MEKQKSASAEETHDKRSRDCHPPRGGSRGTCQYRIELTRPSGDPGGNLLAQQVLLNLSGGRRRQ